MIVETKEDNEKNSNIFLEIYENQEEILKKKLFKNKSTPNFHNNFLTINKNQNHNNKINENNKIFSLFKRKTYNKNNNNNFTKNNNKNNFSIENNSNENENKSNENKSMKNENNNNSFN